MNRRHFLSTASSFAAARSFLHADNFQGGEADGIIKEIV